MLDILLLCTGNATRSILAEAIFNRDGAGRVRAASAGSNPLGMVHHGTLKLLRSKGMPTQGYRSKHWREFAGPGAGEIDLVITLCREAAEEPQPNWPGAPLSWHWEVDEPTTVSGDPLEQAFQLAYHQLSSRINGFLILPLEEMTRTDLRDWLTAS